VRSTQISTASTTESDGDNEIRRRTDAKHPSIRSWPQPPSVFL
jgi:hypothetical protein